MKSRNEMETLTPRKSVTACISGGQFIPQEGNVSVSLISYILRHIFCPSFSKSFTWRMMGRSFMHSCWYIIVVLVFSKASTHLSWPSFTSFQPCTKNECGLKKKWFNAITSEFSSTNPLLVANSRYAGNCTLGSIQPFPMAMPRRGTFNDESRTASAIREQN